MALFLGLAALSLLLLGGVAVASVLILPACALQSGLLERFADCPPEAELVAEETLVALAADRVQLERSIRDLERELAGLQCDGAGPPARRPLSTEGWNNAAFPMLYGCWDVSLDYQTRDVDTNAVTSYRDWQICFDAAGNGRQRMQDMSGVICEGPVTAEYGSGGLSLLESDNLPCSDGGYVHRRDILCRLAGTGGAVCSTIQPETGGEAEVTLARRPVDNR